MLFAFSLPPALQERADRTAWLQSVDNVKFAPVTGTEPATTYSTLRDYYQRLPITVVSVAGNTPDAPVPPGLSRLPDPGEAFVSAALSRLTDDTPVLSGRYGQPVGTLSDEAVAGPDDLVVVRGVTLADAELFGFPVTGFQQDGSVPRLEGILRVLLLVGTAGMLAPIALFAALSTRLSAATRDQRLARLRLIGASSTQLSRLASVETGLSGALGIVLGVGLFVAARPPATRLSYDGGRWFTHDLNPGVVGFTVTIVGALAVTLAAAHVTLARVRTTPLVVSARATTRSIGARQLFMLLLAAALLVLAFTGGVLGQGPATVAAFSALLLTLLVAGPPITLLAGQVLARSQRPAALIAGKRLSTDPHAGFVATAGAVVAVLVTTLFLATTPAAVASLEATTVIGQQEGSAQATIRGSDTQRSGSLDQGIEHIAGVGATALVYTGLVENRADPVNIWIGDCESIAQAARLRGVPCGKAPLIVADNYPALLGADALTLYDLDPATPTPITAAPDPEAVTEAMLRVGSTAIMPAQSGIDVPGVIADPGLLSALTEKLRPDLLVFAYESSSALEQARNLTLQLPSSYVSTVSPPERRRWRATARACVAFTACWPSRRQPCSWSLPSDW